ncbi:MAG TPA: hypothetical protein VNT51_11275, partial [Miltoncostaeaceae bacterium]|nr:hypothetical protein [Miltoncostaeaceae bacterium]
MTTRPLGPQPFIPEDPGPWSGILDVLQRRGSLPGRRRAEPPNGLMISPPPRTSLTLAGGDPLAPVAGAGPVRVVAAAREPAVELSLSPDGAELVGVSRMVRRRWSADDLTVLGEERAGEDPAAGVPPPVWIDDLAEGDLPPAARLSPDGAYAVVPVTEPPRYGAVAVVRVADRAVVRYVRFARCGCWTADGERLVVGGEWG